MDLPRRPRVFCLPTGPDEYSVAMVRALALLTEVTLVAPHSMVERFGGDLPATVTVHALAWPRHSDPRSLSFVWRILSLVRMAKPDVVHFLGDSVFWLTLALPFLRKHPIVVTVHDVVHHPGDDQSRVVPRTTIGLLRRAADALIVHGAALRRELVASAPARGADVHIVAHPVLDRHRRLAAQLGLTKAPANGPRILFFGRIMAYKGLDLLIEASDQVVRQLPNACFIVAGTGPELDRLRPELDRRPWFQVHARYVSDGETAQLFTDADILALPYVEASQSGVLAQAAGYGLAVVATNVGEMGALVDATGMGLVVPPVPSAIADAIMSLLGNASLRRECARAAAQAAEGILSPGVVAAGTVMVYRHAMQRRRVAAWPQAAASTSGSPE